MATKAVKAVFFDLGETLVTKNRKWVSGGKDALSRLRAKGVRLGVISNTGDLPRAELLAELPTDFKFSLFEDALVILSSEVGVAKPSPAIFELAPVRAGLRPEECLFCTEDLLHTLAAQRAGMRAARTLPPPASDVGSLAQALADAGLI
jgi:FMN phosphatase YigB (HAD superfamily)